MTTPAQWRLKIAWLAEELVIRHNDCPIQNMLRCEMFLEMVDLFSSLVEDAVAEERSPLLCGHPRACLTGNPTLRCSVCMEKTNLADRIPVTKNVKLGGLK